jgi:hypothetical protein
MELEFTDLETEMNTRNIEEWYLLGYYAVWLL